MMSKSLFPKSLLFAAALWLAGCQFNSRQPEHHDDQAEIAFINLLWLCRGNWVQQDPDGGRFIERWKRSSESLYTGDGVWLSDRGDTVFREDLRIERRDDELYYIADTGGDSGRVDFKMTYFDEQSITFENPAHDFPRSITYVHPHPDSLIAILQGVQRNESVRETFRMVRKH